MKTVEEKLQLLDETIKYYSEDPINRRCSTSDTCVYSPITANKPLSNGCAIGRLLTPELKLELDKLDPMEVSVKDDVVFNQLPLDIQRYGRQFLFQLQHIHDIDNYWNSKGLSKTGEEYYKETIRRINDLVF